MDPGSILVFPAKEQYKLVQMKYKPVSWWIQDIYLYVQILDSTNWFKKITNRFFDGSRKHISMSSYWTVQTGFNFNILQIGSLIDLG